MDENSNQPTEKNENQTKEEIPTKENKGESLTKHELRELRKKEAKEEREKQQEKSQKNLLSKNLKYIVAFIVILVLGYLAYSSLSNLPNIGALGSTHIHADLGLFLDGKEITPLPEKYFVKIREVHMEGGPGVGTVIHMHATGVPLKLFFDSLGMRFDSKSFKLDTGEEYVSDQTKTLKMFVKHKDGTWQENTEFEKYAFSDLDKILITYGNESGQQIADQQAKVTDFSKDNSERKMIL